MYALVGSKVTLKMLTSDHIPLYLAAFTLEVRTILRVSSLQSEYDYLLERLALMRDDKTFFFVIFDKKNRCIGGLEIRREEHPGQLYTWLHPSVWSQGYFAQALHMASRWYFAVTQKGHFTARVDESNRRSYYALKGAGFVDYRLINGPHEKQYEMILRNCYL